MSFARVGLSRLHALSAYTCVYVYVCVCMHVCVYIYKSYVLISVHIPAYTRIYTFLDAHIYQHIQSQKHTPCVRRMHARGANKKKED